MIALKIKKHHETKTKLDNAWRKRFTKIASYETGLGWKKSPSSMDDLALFDLGGMVLCLYPRKALAEDVTVDDIGSGFTGITLAYNAKSEEEVDRLSEVEKLGATVLKPGQKVFWGGFKRLLQRS